MTQLVNATPHAVRIWLDGQGFELPRGRSIIRVGTFEHRDEPLRIDLGGGEWLEVPTVVRHTGELEEIELEDSQARPFVPKPGVTYIVSAYVLAWISERGLAKERQACVAPQSNRAYTANGRVQAVSGFVRAG